MMFDRWPINVKIFQKRAGGSWQVKETKAERLKKKDGKITYRLKNGKSIPPIKYENLLNDNTLLLQQDQEGSYAPMKVSEGEIKGIDVNVKNWAIEDAKEDLDLWKDPGFFAKYGHFIATAGVLITIGVMIYISLEKIIELNQVGAQALQHLKQIMETKVQTAGY